MKKWKRILGNAVITALIVFFSTLSVSYPPSVGNVYAAIIGGVLALLPQLKEIFEDPNVTAFKRQNGDKPLGVFL